MAGERYPDVHEVDADLTLEAIRSGIAIHWREYFSRPPAERLGDEETWDASLVNTVIDLGIHRKVAENICVLAKLEAQFPE
jgi:hypothetical protein